MNNNLEDTELDFGKIGDSEIPEDPQSYTDEYNENIPVDIINEDNESQEDNENLLENTPIDIGIADFNQPEPISVDDIPAQFSDEEAQDNQTEELEDMGEDGNDFAVIAENKDITEIPGNQGEMACFDFRIPFRGKESESLKLGDGVKTSKGLFNEFLTYQINKRDVGAAAHRRFSDFEKLHKYLVGHYSSSFFPHLPEKNALVKIKNLAGEEFLLNRKKSLEMFLKKLLTHSICKKDTKVKEFMDGSYTDFNVSVNDSKFKSLASDFTKISKNKIGKGFGFIKGFFGGNSRPEATLTSGASNEMRSLQTLIKDMNKKLGTIIENFEEVLKKMALKAEAGEAQAKTFEEISASEEEFDLGTNLVCKLQEIQNEVSKKEREFAIEMKEGVLFYLKDLKKDVFEALRRIELYIEKTESLVSRIHKAVKNKKESDESIYKARKEAHDTDQKCLHAEITKYISQVSESIEYIFSIYFEKADERNKLEITKWSEIKLSDFDSN